MRLVAGAVLMIAGCAAVPPDREPPPAAGNGERACIAEGLESLLGRPASEALGAEALRRSGAGALRWIRPGDAVTMDYREDRLNIHLDGRGRVERFACG